MDAACIVLDVDGVTAMAHAHADTFARIDEEVSAERARAHTSLTAESIAAHGARAQLRTCHTVRR